MKIVQPPRKRCRLSIMSCTHGVRMLSFHPCTTKAYFSLVLQPNCVNLVSSDDTNWSPVLERNKMRLSDNDEKFLSESSRVDKKLYKLQKFLFFSLAKLKPLSVINEWKWECSCCCRMTFNMFPHFSFNYELWDLFFSQFTFSSSEMILQTKVEITRFVVFIIWLRSIWDGRWRCSDWWVSQALSKYVILSTASFVKLSQWHHRRHTMPPTWAIANLYFVNTVNVIVSSIPLCTNTALTAIISTLQKTFGNI